MLAALFLVAGAPCHANKTHAPLPEKVLTAKAVFIENHGRADIADQAYDELKKWGHFEIVTDRSKADIILVLSVDEGSTTSGSTSVYHYIVLTLRGDGAMSRQNERKYLARLITEFVNRSSENQQCSPEGFIRKYGVPRYRFGAREISWVVPAFRQAWDKSQKEAFAQNMERVFADLSDEVYRELDKQAETVYMDENRMAHESDEQFERRRAVIQERQKKAGTRFTFERGPCPAELWKYTRPAFRVVPGKRGLVFLPRDPLDRMARELLRAFASKRLRVCGRKDKGCPTPLFVAYHAKQKYCYRGCGTEALSEWKAGWQANLRGKKSISRRGK